MTYTNEKLGQHAHELALQHTLTAARAQPKYIRNQFDADVESLRKFVSALLGSHAGCAQQAEEWLLDNAEFIEEQALVVRMQLSRSSLANLPRLRNNGKLRIQSLCEAYLGLVDGVLQEESIVSYINAYQEISVLTLAETRSIPLILRVALIGRVAETMVMVRDRHEVCVEVQRLLSRIEPSKLNPEVISAGIGSSRAEYPVIGPLDRSLGQPP